MHTNRVQFILCLSIKVLSVQDLCPLSECFAESSISTCAALGSLKVISRVTPVFAFFLYQLSLLMVRYPVLLGLGSGAGIKGCNYPQEKGNTENCPILAHCNSEKLDS